MEKYCHRTETGYEKNEGEDNYLGFHAKKIALVNRLHPRLQRCWDELAGGKFDGSTKSLQVRQQRRIIGET